MNMNLVPKHQFPSVGCRYRLILKTFLSQQRSQLFRLQHAGKD